MSYDSLRNKGTEPFYTFSYSRPAVPLTVGPSILVQKLFDIFCKKYLLFFEPRAIITESLVNSSETVTRRGSVW